MGIEVTDLAGLKLLIATFRLHSAVDQRPDMVKSVACNSYIELLRSRLSYYFETRSTFTQYCGHCKGSADCSPGYQEITA